MDARALAGREGARFGGLGEQAPQAGAPGKQRGHQATRDNDAAVHPGYAKFHAGVVDDVAGGHVVQAVHDQVGALHQRQGVAGRQVLVHGLYAGLREQDQELLRQGVCLWLAHVGVAQHPRPVEVGQLQHVTVDQSHVAKAHADQHLGGVAAEGAGAHDGHGRLS